MKCKTVHRIEEQLMKLHVQATDREENKQIALGTSKLNYLDPRISVAWYLFIYSHTKRMITSLITSFTTENSDVKSVGHLLFNRPVFSEWVGVHGACLPC